ncbi:hypothetical protein Aduo_009490 [Ancylostoma duodenale]
MEVIMRVEIKPVAFHVGKELDDIVILGTNALEVFEPKLGKVQPSRSERKNLQAEGASVDSRAGINVFLTSGCMRFPLQKNMSKQRHQILLEESQPNHSFRMFKDLKVNKQMLVVDTMEMDCVNAAHHKIIGILGKGGGDSAGGTTGGGDAGSVTDHGGEKGDEKGVTEDGDGKGGEDPGKGGNGGGDKAGGGKGGGKAAGELKDSKEEKRKETEIPAPKLDVSEHSHQPFGQHYVAALTYHSPLLGL